MFGRMSTAELAEFQGKDVVVFSQEWIWWHLPTKTPSHSNLTSQTASSASALQSALVSGCLGPHPAYLSCEAMSVVQALGWQPPLLPLGSSSSGSEGMPYCFSPQWQHSCCHCTFLCRHSTSSNLGSSGPSTAHRAWVITSSMHQWMQSSYMHAWFGMRRCQSFCNLWQWLPYCISWDQVLL